MKLSLQTINVLKNFATINSSIVLKSGNVISTMSTNKTIVAKATVPDEFPHNIGIYKLNEFIGALSLLENPNLDFGDTSVTINGDGDSQIIFHYSEISTIVTPPEKEIRLPSVDVEVKLTNKDIQKVTKALSLFGLPELAVVGDGEQIWLQAIDVKNSGANVFRVHVGESDQVFRAVFRSENMKMIDGDYIVKISSKGISQFIGIGVTYWIANEATSTF